MTIGTIQRLQIRELIARHGHTFVYRVALSDGHVAVLKTHGAEHPPESWLVKLRHEHNVLQLLADSPGVPALIGDGWSEGEDGRHGLLLQDHGAADVAEMLAEGPMPVDTCVEIALAVARALAAIHDRRVIHRDINPSNIIYNRQTGYVGIIDYGIASLMPRQRVDVNSAISRTLVGTLHYLAPEQSGRMNRSVDHRADFYALGVTLYQMLTGKVPFAAAQDALELLHAHIAVQPEPPHILRPALPEPLSLLVMRLLEKSPERRYQSAHGLAADLALVAEGLRAIAESQRHDPAVSSTPLAPLTTTLATAPTATAPSPWRDLVLGRYDIADRLQIPERLYGREAQVAILERAWAGTVAGGAALALVAGSAGLGKSSLVGELRRPVLAAHGNMVQGKGEQLVGQVPYRPIAQAVQDLSEQLLRTPEASLRVWQRRLRDAVGPYGNVLVALVPALGHILGESKPLAELSAREAKQRFFHVCARFFAACTGPEHPMLLWIDDLQWVDDASMQLLGFLLAEVDVRHFAVVGTYRDDEVGPGHPLAALRTKVEQRGHVDVVELALTPLSQGDLARLLLDTLRRSPGRPPNQHGDGQDDDGHNANENGGGNDGDDGEIMALAALCLHQSQGNPFVVRELLVQWHEDGLITLSRDQEGLPSWSWDRHALAQSGIREGVAELMTKRLARLEAAPMRALAHAACAGTRFRLAHVVAAMDESPAACGALLQCAVAEDLLFIDAEGERALVALSHGNGGGAGDIGDTDAIDDGHSGHLDIEFRFRHDRIRAAAYEHLPAAQRAHVHLELARFLRRAWRHRYRNGDSDGDMPSEALFEVLQHYNRHWRQIDDEHERERVAEDNLNAAVAAISAAAYGVAADYCRIGIALLGSDAWQRTLAVTMALHHTAAIAALASGAREACEHAASLAIAHSGDSVERARLHLIRTENYVRHHAYSEAVAAARAGLACIDIALPEPGPAAAAAVDALDVALGPDWVARLVAHPLHVVAQESPIPVIAYRIYEVSSVAILYVDISLWRWMGRKLVQIFSRGVSPSVSTHVYITAAMLLVTEGHYREAHTLGHLAIEAARRAEVPGILCQATSATLGFTLHWGRPLRSLFALYDEAVADGRSTGQHLWVSSLLLSALVQRFYAGSNMAHLREMIEEGEHRGDTASYMTRDIVAVLQAAIRSLSGQTTTSSSATALDPAHMSEDDLVDALRSQAGAPALGYYWVIKAQLCYLQGQFAAAEQAAEEALGKLKAAGQFVLVASTFYYLLSHISQIQPPSETATDTDSDADSVWNRSRWTRGMADMERWADIAPMNCGHYLCLLEAEAARAEGQAWAAVDRYHRAIDVARSHGFVQDQGLMHERLALHWLAMGEVDYACLHLARARAAFASWGAKPKAAALERQWTVLRQRHSDAEAPDEVHAGPPSDRDAGGPSDGDAGGPGEGPGVTERAATDEGNMPALARGTVQGTVRGAEQDASAAEDALSLSTVMAASQWISGQLMLDELGPRLLQVSLESTGAERACLLQPRSDGVWYVEREAAATPEPSTRTIARVLADCGHLVPLTVITHICRTNAACKLDSAATTSPWAEDVYIAEHGVRSILGMLITMQSRSVGMVYLEVRAREGAFSANHVEIMRVLAAQAAISLENARLYGDLQQINRELEDRVERRTAELRAAQSELLMQAHRAGRAELAIDTVHNIGNALGAVRVNAALFAEMLDKPVAARYRRANQLLLEHRDHLGRFFAEDPRAANLVNYYLQVDAAWQQQQAELRQNNSELLEQIAIIEEVIQAQRAYTETDEVRERKDIARLVMDALALSESTLSELGIALHITPPPPDTDADIDVDVMRIHHVLAELVENAKDAICAAHNFDTRSDAGPGAKHEPEGRPASKTESKTGGDKRIDITMGADEQAVWVRIQDSGIGLQAAELEQVFRHGYSQKPGHRGFGLHNAANYIARLGGSLRLESDGVGQGATAIVRLPRNVAAADK